MCDLREERIRIIQLLSVVTANKGRRHLALGRINTGLHSSSTKALSHDVPRRMLVSRARDFAVSYLVLCVNTGKVNTQTLSSAA